MSDDFDDELLALAGGDEDVEVEEGEASSPAPSSPNSLGSGAMEESDSERDDDVPARDTDVPYPLEGKYVDAKDKQRIQAMSQLEREEILGQRAEEMSKANFQAQVLRAAMNSRKRKAESQEPDDSQRKSSRQVKPKTNDRLEAYKRDREQKGQQRQRVDDGRRDRRRSSSGEKDGGSDIDAEGEEDVDWEESRKAVLREEQPAHVGHFESVRVGRGYLSKYCCWPKFDEVVTGTYARIGIGQDSQRRTLYRMAQVKGIVTGKPYIFEGFNNQKIATDQYITCQYGSTKKDYQFHYLSNQGFTDSDFETYKQSLSETGAKLPPQSVLRKKYDDMRAFKNRFWTDADINARIAKQSKFTHLIHRADEATAKIPTQTEAAANRLAEINRQNQKAEKERIRKAQLEERHEKQRKKKRALLAAQKQKAEEERLAKEKEQNGSLEVDDLFGGGDSAADSPPKPEAAEQPKEKKSSPPQRKGLPTFRTPKMDSDILSALDITLDIEI